MFARSTRNYAIIDLQVIVISALLSRAPDPTYTCGTRGFVTNEVGERPRRKIIIEETLRDQGREVRLVFYSPASKRNRQWT
jgi:hypothetical protein